MRRDQPTRQGPRSLRPCPLSLLRFSLAALALGVTIWFSVSVDQAWEDFFINYRHSENLVEGNGLSFSADERVHGFTSPVATLGASAARAITGPAEPEAVLWVYRVPSLLCHAAALWLLLLALHRAGVRSILGTVLVGGLYALEMKGVAFSVNGMETGFLLFFVAGSLLCLCSGICGREIWLGVNWAGLMWTRPDGCILIAAMGIAVLLLAEGPRRQLFMSLLKAAGVCTLLYLPWFAWAWWYYGSPVPHPVIAKGARASSTAATLAQLREMLPQFAWLHLPPYAWAGDLRAVQYFEALALGLVGCLTWPWRRVPKRVRQVSLIALLGILYLTLIPIRYPWYYPATMACSLLGVGWAMGALEARFLSRPPMRAWLAVGVLALVAGQLPGVLRYFETSRLAQRINDMGVRRSIGLWLAENTDPADRVFAEPLGYLGYYSKRTFVDYPGLASPVVVAVRKEHGDDPAVVVSRLRPEWLVLRPHELEYLRASLGRELEEGWVPVIRFDATEFWPEDVRERSPGSLYDARFDVFGRRDVVARQD